ncbi:MAG: bifunctional diguanylate cyclase/phosphodiesterase [Campylobacterota bacterium]|nr:bifunctional diguanylate cyclase/phosphodiesterase [Campylobacterota bacterium]
MVKLREFFLFVSLVLLGIFFVYLYAYIKEAQQEIFSRIEANNIKQLSYIFKNIEDEIILDNSIKDTQSLILLLSDEKTRDKYEKTISIMITPSVKYIYLLVKDKRDRFRFLLDASKIDKANFYQKFDVQNEKYQDLYKTKEPQVIRQEKMENLFLTYLYPIKIENEVIAVLSVDITTKIKKTVLTLIKPLETFFIILIIFVFLLIVMTIVQVFHYFMTRKKIFTDPLTQLYNRNYLQEIAPMLKLHHYSIAMLDLDRFKIINDTYGHKTGDYVLHTSSKIIKDSIRESDIIIRYGGEEFLLFIYKRNLDESAQHTCDRIRENIDTHMYHYDKHDIKMQISIGLHENPHLEKNLQEAIKIADKMLYIAKNGGRNRVVSYNEKAQDMSDSKLKDIEFVKEAIEEDRVTCFYQPIYNHKEKKIFKYEALVRIIDKKGDIISPNYFLPLLKHTNIHYKLTQRILCVIFNKFKNSSLHVSININFSDLINQDIESTIVQTFQEHKDLASRVTFEILESDEIKDMELFKQKIDLLHSFGAKISIDDFGSGYSNFRSILDIDTNYLKIDGSLIKNIDTNDKDFKVVNSIVHFAKEANLKTIAEFVHSKEVYNKLLNLDVDYMQGYYISEPLAEIPSLKELFK